MNLLKQLKKPFIWIYTTLHLLVIRISIGLFNAEEAILKADPNALNEKGKKDQKVRIRNPLHKKMNVGQRDEQYVKDFYEVLKKADKFIRNATPEQMEIAANTHGMSLGKTDEELKNVGNKGVKAKKDKWGRRYDHFGFYDPKNKNYGKTMGEVIVEEIKERITKDDDNQIEFMFSNIPKNIGLLNNHELIGDDNELRSLNGYEKSKVRKFPMKVLRDNDESFNKIETLTEYLHVKRLDDIHKILEFFIPAKYKLFDHDENSDIFKELININQVWINDEYHEKYGYNVYDYSKKTEVIDESIPKDKDQVIYHVIKLKAKAIKKIN